MTFPAFPDCSENDLRLNRRSSDCVAGPANSEQALSLMRGRSIPMHRDWDGLGTEKLPNCFNACMASEIPPIIASITFRTANKSVEALFVYFYEVLKYTGRLEIG